MRIVFPKCTRIFSFPFFFLFALFTLGIELGEDGSLDGSSDLTIKGRLLSLVEKVTYLKKKQTEKPVERDARKSCKQSERALQSDSAAKTCLLFELLYSMSQ